MVKVVGRILNLLVWMSITILILVMFIVPMSFRFLAPPGTAPGPGMMKLLNFWRYLHWPVMQAFAVAWVFFVGACVGSFLNVVALRLPRGRSIVGSSECPQCNVNLKFFSTNIPILGWFKNGGKCFNCEWPIPVRYLIVELVVGFSFLVLFTLTAVSGGISVPFHKIYPVAGLENVLHVPKFDLLSLLGYQLVLISIVFALAAIAKENYPAPANLVVFGLIAGAVIQCLPVSPGIVDFRLANWSAGGAGGSFLQLYHSPIDFVISISLGVLASTFGYMAIAYCERTEPFGTFGALVLIGAFLGWQSVLSICVIWFVLSLFLSFNAGTRVFIALMLHFCLWRFQTLHPLWPGPASGLNQLMCAIAYIGALAVILNFLNTRFKQKVKSSTHSVKESAADLPAATSDLR